MTTGLDHKAHPLIDCAFDHSLSSEYDKDGCVRFVEGGFYSGCGCQDMFAGRSIDEYSAEDLVPQLSEIDGGDHLFNQVDYCVPSIMLTVCEADPPQGDPGGEPRPVYDQAANVSETTPLSRKGQCQAHLEVCQHASFVDVMAQENQGW